ncbi:MupG family TIM beta-alpha barrel fold protein [Sulfobacillus thermosulfidooxidans]|uniref:MupG family TIM beta-alpha barrel fold protein n=1 Tax=Sulfobacillus thermosulfidooxidans TaxID=28034 RepID=UPI001FA6B8E4|nr:MupG family TIM beta-alpha barrel fold protein [Sulfobacillus thermosulfidooxidans]
MAVGTSFYIGIPSSTKKSAYDCVALALDMGIQHFFTTVQMPEASIADHLEEFRAVAQFARGKNVRIMADVHPIAFQRVGGNVANLTPLQELGITDLRLDAGFSEEETLTLYHTASRLGMRIVLNASAVTAASLQRFHDLGLPLQDMVACHNYYPRIESGMSTVFMAQQATLLHRFGITVVAFVASQSHHRYVTYEGLPTLEVHRFLEPHRAARELLSRGWADHVYIGDQTENAEELSRLAEVRQSPHLILRLQLSHQARDPERKIVLGRVHEHLPQLFELTCRARGDRQRPTLETITPAPELLPRPRGTVAVDNVLYPRYAGELHIAKVDLPADPRTNVVGRVIPDDQRLIDAIGPRTRFAFEAVGGFQE